MKEIYDNISFECSKFTTKQYSTSFSLGIRFLDKKIQKDVYSIYGFVRLADEIVDTFHDFDKADLLDRFKADTYKAIEEGISLNPILNAFQHTVRQYNIDKDLIDTFLRSMEMDLQKVDYDQVNYEDYIVGSAEVVGLMCLKVFTYGDQKHYDKTKYYAERLGAAFQKINFLRDIQADYQELGRTYFPNLNLDNFTEADKKEIEKDIEKDFADGYIGIKMLPKSSRLGVYVAYVYYNRLFRKIQGLPSEKIFESRIRIPNNKKYRLFVGSYLKHSFNLL